MSGDIEYDLPGLRVALTAEQADDQPPRTPCAPPWTFCGAWGLEAGELETFAEWFIRGTGRGIQHGNRTVPACGNIAVTRSDITTLHLGRRTRSNPPRATRHLNWSAANSGDTTTGPYEHAAESPTRAQMRAPHHLDNPHRRLRIRMSHPSEPVNDRSNRRGLTGCPRDIASTHTARTRRSRHRPEPLANQRTEHRR